MDYYTAKRGFSAKGYDSGATSFGLIAFVGRFTGDFLIAAADWRWSLS
jgi:hypothetical protein